MPPGPARFRKKSLPVRYFSADDELHGRERRKTNGTEAGPGKFIEAVPAPNGMAPSGLSIFGKSLKQ